MAINVEVVSSFEEQLRSSAMRSIGQLSAALSGDTPLAAELRSKFEEAIADIADVKFDETGPDYGSFFVTRGTLTIAQEPVAKLLFAAMDCISSPHDEHSLDHTELFELFDRVLAGYVFHELRHRTQGVEVYQRVADVRATGGEMVMAQLDAAADRDAAVAVAAINTGSGRDEFLSAFQEALYLSAAFYFRVFPIKAERPDKVARALGVLLMLARLAAARTATGWREDPKFALDAPMFVYLKSDMKLLTVWRGEPNSMMLGHSNDAEEFDELVGDVVEGRFDAAISKCIRLLRKIRVIR